MDRGEIRLAKVGSKSRPVVLLTRPEVIEVRELVTVAEVTTTIRGLAVEIGIDPDTTGINRPSVVNCDGLHTVPRARLTRRVGSLDETTLEEVCWAVGYALGC
jgi:mRNA interferase MazF